MTHSSISISQSSMSEKCKEIPEDWWELILNHLPNQTHFQPLSLVSKQFLHLTNRLRHKLSITDPLILLNPQISKLINKRFPNLTSIDFTNYTGNVEILLLGISNSCSLEKLFEIDLGNVNKIPIRGLKNLGGGIRVFKCRNLRVLRDNDFVEIGGLFKCLEELDVSYPRMEIDLKERGGFRGASEMTVTDFGIGVLVRSVRSLRRVNFSGNHFVTDKSLVCLAENCEFLERVDVVDCTLVTGKGFLFLLRNCGRLKSVSVSDIEIRSECIVSDDTSFVAKSLSSLVICNSYISDEFMQMLVDACVDLRRLSLVRCTVFTVSSLALLLRRCHSLQHLTLCEVFVASPESEVDFLTEETIVQLSSYLHNLVSLQLSGVPLLALSTFHEVAKSCPLLEFVQMECTLWGSSSLFLNPTKYPNIRSLNISGGAYISNRFLNGVALACPKLETLDVSDCTDITENCLAEILETCHEIRILSIIGCRVNSIGQGLELPKLEVLNASYSSIDDEGLVQIASRCPGIVKLDLAGCSRVTETGVKEVVGNCRILKEINLANCVNVNVSILDWMFSTRSSLVKIVPPSYTSISNSQKRFYLQHGRQIWGGSKSRILNVWD